MRILAFLSLFFVSGVLCAEDSAEVTFWKWFEANEEMIFNLDKDVEGVVGKVSKALDGVGEDVTFEFSGVENGKREFVISAGGMVGSFPKVESLYKSAPKLKRWTWIKYKQRKSAGGHVTLRGEVFKDEDVRYLLWRDKKTNELGIVVFFEGFREAEKDKWARVGFIVLDQILGEYDVTKGLGSIEFAGKESEFYKESRSATELAEHFDEAMGREVEVKKDGAVGVAESYFSALTSGDVEAADKLVGVPFSLDDEVLKTLEEVKGFHRQVLERMGKRVVPEVVISRPKEFVKLEKVLFGEDYEVVRFTVTEEGDYEGDEIDIYLRKVGGEWVVIGAED